MGSCSSEAKPCLEDPNLAQSLDPKVPESPEKTKEALLCDYIICYRSPLIMVYSMNYMIFHRPFLIMVFLCN